MSDVLTTERCTFEGNSGRGISTSAWTSTDDTFIGGSSGAQGVVSGSATLSGTSFAGYDDADTVLNTGIGELSHLTVDGGLVLVTGGTITDSTFAGRGSLVVNVARDMLEIARSTFTGRGGTAFDLYYGGTHLSGEDLVITGYDTVADIHRSRSRTPAL